MAEAEAKAKRANVGEETDIISTLPDEILSFIVSFLPLREAIQTSILSRRWTKIFGFRPNLKFTGGFEAGNSDSFMNLVDGVLSHRTGILDNLRIRCGEYVDPPRVDRWIQHALGNRIRELDLCIDCKTLPCEVFSCRTLEELRLTINGGFVLQLPEKICLPNLKRLLLHRMEISSHQRLISSCSVLEELIIRGCHSDNRCRLNVFNLTLKRLTISGIWGFDEDYGIEIDAPRLVYFKCSFLHKRFVLKNLNSLVQVHLGSPLAYYPSSLYSGSAASALFNGISNVQSLHLSCFFAKDYLQGSCQITELPKLTYLKLEAYMFELWDIVLPNLLACCPCVQALDLKVKLYPERDIKPLKKFPSSLASQLKRLKMFFSSFECNNSELQLIEYFLKNAEVLENFTLEAGRKRSLMTSKWRSNITKTLLKIPKISKNCEILFV